MSDRVLGVSMLIVAVLFGAAAGQLEVTGPADVAGPTLFPRIVAIFVGLISVFLIIRPDPDPNWAEIRYSKVLGGIIVITLYGAFIADIGFPLATTAAVFALARLFGARTWHGLWAGIWISLGLFIIFDSILGLPLPLFPDI